MKWRNSKERELLASGGTREQTLPNRNNPNPDLTDVSGNNVTTTTSHAPKKPLSPAPFQHTTPPATGPNGAAGKTLSGMLMTSHAAPAAAIGRQHHREQHYPTLLSTIVGGNNRDEAMRDAYARTDDESEDEEAMDVEPPNSLGAGESRSLGVCGQPSSITSCNSPPVTPPGHA
jgi:hypothetical protein